MSSASSRNDGDDATTILTSLPATIISAASSFVSVMVPMFCTDSSSATACSCCAMRRRFSTSTCTKKPPRTPACRRSRSLHTSVPSTVCPAFLSSASRTAVRAGSSSPAPGTYMYMDTREVEGGRSCSTTCLPPPALRVRASMLSSPRVTTTTFDSTFAPLLSTR